MRHRVGKRCKLVFVVPPQRHIQILPDNGPNAPVARGLRPIFRRWSGRAIGVRMVVTEHLCAAIACCAMGGDEGSGVDLEMRFGGRVDIRGGLRGGDAVGSAGEDAAAFLRRGIGGVGADLAEDSFIQQNTAPCFRLPWACRKRSWPRANGCPCFWHSETPHPNRHGSKPISSSVTNL